MLEKPAITQVPIHELLAKRWSPRAFDPKQPVTTTQILALIEAARWAPSCYGEEPWRFLICDQTQDPTSWQKALQCLAPANQIWAKNVPLLLIAIANNDFLTGPKAGHPNRWAAYDTGAACENLCLQAVNLGLMAHQMGGFSPEQIATAFQLPENVTCMTVIAIGYQADPQSLEDEFYQREIEQRQRRLLETCFFAGQWSQPWKN